MTMETPLIGPDRIAVVNNRTREVEDVRVLADGEKYFAPGLTSALPNCPSHIRRGMILPRFEDWRAPPAPAAEHNPAEPNDGDTND